MDDLRSRVALITGASGGIGRALANTLAAHGMHLSLLDVDSEGLADTAAVLARTSPDSKVRTSVVDVSDADGVAAAVATTEAELGSVDLLGSNAGILRPGAVWEQSPQFWSRVLAVNVLGTVNLVNAALPSMLTRQQGHVVITVGATALFTAPFSPPGSYAVSKHALLAYAETLFEELTVIGAPIGVTALCPTGVRSAIADDSTDEPDADGDVVRRPDVWRRVEALRAFIRHGMEPADLAELAVQAVRERRFWVFPDSSIPLRAAHRADYITRGADPCGPPLGVSAAAD